MTRLAPLLLLALLLGAAILAELASAPDLQPPRVLRPHAVPPHRVAAQADGSAQWAADSLARPLFSPDRRPAASGATAGAAAPGLPRLAGTLVTPAGRRAIFAGAGKPVTVTEGGTVDGYVVQSIAAGQVILAGTGGVHVLRPSFDPNRPAVQAPAFPLPQLVPPPPPPPARPGSTP